MPESSDENSNSPAMPSGNAAVPAGGYKPMKAQPGADQYTPSEAIKKAALPKTVDLRPSMTPVEDQGQTSSCVANAVAGAYEYGVKRVTKQNNDVSRLFVYFNARWRENEPIKDDGCVIQHAMEGLQRFGTCPEPHWPFEKPMVPKKPNQTSYKEAAKGKVAMMKQVPVKLETWKQALAEGFPIVFGCVLFDSFDQCTKQHGVVPMPSPEDVGRATHGGHSMLCVGYSDKEKVFIVRNSWGTEFGEKGYCYMPYDYLMNPKFNDGDCWIFTPPTDLFPPTPPGPHDPHGPHTPPAPQPHHGPQYYPLPLPQDLWYYDDRSIINDGRGIDFVIVTYSIEDYDSIDLDFFEDYVQDWDDTLAEDYAEYAEWVAQEQFEQLEDYSVEDVREEYARETGETDFSFGPALVLGAGDGGCSNRRIGG